MSQWITAALLLTGASFVLLAAVGVVRMPDLFTRMQTATKASTLGVDLLLAAMAVHFASLDAAIAALLVIAFLLLTAPVAAHMIARSAYFVGVPLWPGTVVDELHEQFAHRQPPPAIPPEQLPR